MTPLVTVVIPNYNYARFLPAAIDSVLAQTFTDLEVLVVDDGSTDDSLEVLRSYGDRIRWIVQKNAGQSAARNRGLAESRGRFIALLDADDVWLPTKLERQMALFENRPDVGIVYCGFWAADASLQPFEPVLPMYRGEVLEQFAMEAGAVVRGGESTAVIRKECFDEAGGFDPELSIGAGWDLYRRVCGRYQIDAVTEPLALYRIHGTNASRAADVYAHDVRVRLKKMFGDPNALRVRRYRRRSYAKSYLAIGGTYFHANRPWRAFLYAARSICVWPPSIRFMLRMPNRGVKRSSEHDLAPGSGGSR
jgi:glycosyltransferase involved in cell wall biosynthesis